MKICLNLPNINYNTQPMKYYPNLRPLLKDTVSFSAMKKNQFSGIDLMMINRQKAPIEKFNSDGDFQAWCKEKVQRDYISKKDELAKSVDRQAQVEKAKILDEWIQYIEAYTPSIQLMILSSITSVLNKETNYLPPNLDKRIVDDTIYDIVQNCRENPSYNCNFNKLYRNKMQRVMFREETQLDPSLTGWIIIPSRENNPVFFDENVKKLQVLSHDTWCTNTYNAGPYLAEGDFHIYMEKGKPKLAVKFNEDTICEIQGEKNNSKIPLKYLELAKEHVAENGYMLSFKTQDEFRKAELSRKISNNIHTKLQEHGVDLKNCSTKQLFDILEIKYEEDKDGKLILEEYRQPDNNCSFSDLGIDENRLFQDIVEIKGNVDFKNSDVTNLGSLRIIGGTADFRESQITDLGSLREIGIDALFGHSKITHLGCLTKIGRNANFESSRVSDLGCLKYVGQDADFRYSALTDLGQLEVINGYADFRYSDVSCLGKLKTILRNAYFGYSKITSLGCLETIGENADFENSKVADLGELSKIGANAYFSNSEITSLGKLKVIGGYVWFDGSKIIDLGELEVIGRKASFEKSKVASLGKLKTINGKIIENAKTPEDLNKYLCE